MFPFHSNSNNNNNTNNSTSVTPNQQHTYRRLTPLSQQQGSSDSVPNFTFYSSNHHPSSLHGVSHFHSGLSSSSYSPYTSSSSLFHEEDSSRDDKKKDSNFLSVWEQRHRWKLFANHSPYFSMCFICLILLLVSLGILLSIVFFVLQEEEFDQLKIGILMMFKENKRNDWHLQYSIKSDEKYLKFIVLGDWGRRGLFNQTEVAEQMEYYCKNFGCDFVISTGDNFYQDGVKSVDDILFKESFEDVYNQETLSKLPFLSVLGNHCYRSNPYAQVEYTQYEKSTKRLYIPSEYFTEVMYFPEKRVLATKRSDSIETENSDEKQTSHHDIQRKNMASLSKKMTQHDFRVQFLFLDTNPFIQRYYSHPKMNQHALHKTSNLRAQLGFMENMMNELEDKIDSGRTDQIPYFINSERRKMTMDLQSNDENQQPNDGPDPNHSHSSFSLTNIPLWKIAIGHHPLYSASSHGDSDDLVDRLLPFFKRTGISLYFSGHDHNLQYLKLPDNSLHQFISGAGSAVRFDVVPHHPYLQSFQQESGFMYVRLSKDLLDVSFVSLEGKVTNRVKIPKQHS
ncbi:hypothetical protein C9374_002089 [Naegleria lovaniensis]|uniref:Calcineurin-like phosphoesterase domain-containing protein n=1 Tax=Naegleria lovaniensis TaxID=51637 RepID=A0AA88KMK6_NAELO|nr:uncharacterized protein C9374_002089 [Naegleria lovaniensis]KAG2387054.1 hypothetical protein C9374_002089 [Naegleria lovaniensis]